MELKPNDKIVINGTETTIKEWNEKNAKEIKTTDYFKNLNEELKEALQNKLKKEGKL